MKITGKNFGMVLLAIMIVSGPAMAGTKSFVGKGSAVVIEDDRLSATKLAYQAALKKAVSEAMKYYLHKGTADEKNFHIRKNELLRGPFEFIEEETMVSNQLDGKLLKIELQIIVDEEKLKSFLGQEGILVTENKTRKKAEFPSLMVIVVEELNGKINPAPYGAGVVRDALIKKNFEVVDELLVAKSISHDSAVSAVLKGDIKTAQAAALQYGSGIIVKGRMIVQAAALKSGGMQSYSANVILEAVKADTGVVLASVSADGSYPHINEITGSRKAIEEASEKAVKKLIGQLEKGFESSATVVVLTISDVNYGQLAILKKMLERDFQDIEKIKQQSFNGNIGKLELTLKKGGADFADQLALKDFGTFKVRVLTFSPGKIAAAVEMKP
ncbi:MAG: hypothetical protein K8I00_05805 [Candidatus Omnitrophica bacterium]|nr:hypothetical protein [Candidatus Omnitrophota bacterium]